jgi:hypothetical protein
MLETVNLSTFAEHLHTHFQVQGIPDLTIALELVRVEDLGSDADQEQFSLIFRGPSEVMLKQHIFALQHDVVGHLDLFLVPIGREDGGFLYEAVVNRWKQREA